MSCGISILFCSADQATTRISKDVVYEFSLERWKEFAPSLLRMSYFIDSNLLLFALTFWCFVFWSNKCCIFEACEWLLVMTHRSMCVFSFFSTVMMCINELCGMRIIFALFESRPRVECVQEKFISATTSCLQKLQEANEIVRACSAVKLSCVTKIMDSVTEWLRWWTRNPLGSARRGSNPLAVESVCTY